MKENTTALIENKNLYQLKKILSVFFKILNISDTLKKQFIIPKIQHVSLEKTNKLKIFSKS